MSLFIRDSAAEGLWENPAWQRGLPGAPLQPPQSSSRVRPGGLGGDQKVGQKLRAARMWPNEHHGRREQPRARCRSRLPEPIRSSLAWLQRARARRLGNGVGNSEPGAAYVLTNLGSAAAARWARSSERLPAARGREWPMQARPMPSGAEPRAGGGAGIAFVRSQENHIIRCERCSV